MESYADSRQRHARRESQQSLLNSLDFAPHSGQIQGARESQQDSCSQLEWNRGHYLMILADGMGGASGGDVAGKIAVEEFQHAFTSCEKTDVRERLLDALHSANDAIYGEKQRKPNLSDMGTTLVGVAIVHDQMYWVSVGDSPMWLINSKEVLRLNKDHSWGGLLDKRARDGEISWEEAQQSYQRNMLLEAVQGGDIELIDAPREPQRLRPGDTVIVASDGVETCSLDELHEIVTAGRPSASDIVESVLDYVNAQNKPSQDNATLIVYRHWKSNPYSID